MNNKGFGKFESLTILLVIILLIAGGLYLLLKMSNKTKFETMSKSSISFVDAVNGSDNAYINYRTYYLAQALDEGLLKGINSPFSKGNCDINESSITYDSPSYFVNLKCGDYFIKERKYDSPSYKVYKVGEWKDTRNDSSDETRVVYSCKDCNLDGYYEEALFVYLYNKNNSSSYLYLDNVKKATDVISKTQYRSSKLVFEKK